MDFVYGIEDLCPEEGILVYPNPCDGIFFVEFSQEMDREVSLEILDAGGKVQWQETFPPYLMIHRQYDLSGEKPGIHFIRIHDGSYQIVKKLIVQ